jgi:hypothetical protein
VNTAARLGAAAALVALAAYGLSISRPAGELRDYGSFIASGRAAAEGANPYGIHPLTFHVVLPGFEVWNPNLNPPVSVPVFRAFDRMEPHAGFRAWWAASLLCYVLAVGLLAWRYGLRRGWLPALWALALAGFWDTLALGQIYLPLVLAAAGAWLLLERRRPIAAGLLIGLVVAFKPNFAIWPILLWLAGARSAAATAAAAAGLLWAVPLAAYGPAIYHQWVELILNDQGRAAFLTNAAIPGLAARGGLPIAGLLAAAALLAGVAAWALRTRPDPLVASAAGLVAGILASPIAWVHYTLFLLPVFFAWRRSPVLVAAAVLMVVPVPVVLRFLDAPLWQQLTVGSVYNWAALLALAALGAGVAHCPLPGRRVPEPHGRSWAQRVW